jgi:hypothetical protein
MFTLLRRLFWLTVIGGAGYAVYTAWQRKHEPTPDGPPTWPPLDVTPPTPATTPRPGEESSDDSSHDSSVGRDAWTTNPTVDAAPGQRWVAPVDEQCPPGYPIKGNAKSGIYHVPGGRFYERTVPDRCYATEADAAADGYRRAKS